MDLNTVLDVRDARSRGEWRPGDAWLGGGTYLFSNALRDAIGIRFTELPVTRDRVWLAMEARRRDAA